MVRHTLRIMDLVSVTLKSFGCTILFHLKNVEKRTSLCRSLPHTCAHTYTHTRKDTKVTYTFIYQHNQACKKQFSSDLNP